MIKFARSCDVPEGELEDVVANAFAVAYKEDKPRPPREEQNRVKSWLLKLVEFEVKRFRTNRTRKSREVLLGEAEEVLSVPDERPTNGIYILEERESILKALPLVNPKHRDIMLARDVDDELVEDYALRLGISEDTAHTRLRRGHEEMRRALETVDTPVRRRGMVLPFFPAFDALWRAVVAQIKRAFARPLRMAMSVGAGAFFMVVSPPAPEGCGSKAERIDATITQHVLVTAPLDERKRIEGRTCPLPGPGTMLKVSRTQETASDTNGTTFDRPKNTDADGGLLTLLMADAAIARKSQAEAKALLEADKKKRPKVQEHREREWLGESAAQGR